MSVRSHARPGLAGQDSVGRVAEACPLGRAWAIPMVVLLAALFARLPALGSYWCLDDWGQLARAAGRIEAPAGFPARWLSQHAWWSITWPLFGLDAAAHAWLRILLHAIAAVTVVGIARRASLGPPAQLLAGLLFAATPIAFTPLYWASGIQELLGGVLALLAIERWLAVGRANVLLAGLLGIGSILAKESALALPFFFMASLVARRASGGVGVRLRWGVAVLVAGVAAWESALILRHFATGSRDPYALGGALVMLGNLGKFGWWLPTPGPVFTAQVTWTLAGVGIALFLAWGMYGAQAWHRGRQLPLTAWACALLSLGPVLPLVNQARPYMGYLAAAAGSLTLASLVPVRLRLNGLTAAGLAIGTILWGQVTMREWMSRPGAEGLPADPVVCASQIAREAAKAIRELIPPESRSCPFDLFIFQAQLTIHDGDRGPATAKAALETPRYTALAGPLGAGLLLGTLGRAQWTNSLLETPADAFVLCEKGSGFQVWGTTHDALLYAAELHVIAGNYERAAAHLARALALDATRELQIPDRDVLGIPRSALRARAEEFHGWLEAMVMNDRMSSEKYSQYRRFLAVR